MTSFINRLRFSASNSPGSSGDIVVGAADAGFRALGAADDGKTIDITIEQGTEWEIRTGCVYTHSGSTLTRGALADSSTGSSITFTAGCVVTSNVTAAFAGRVQNRIASHVKRIRRIVDFFTGTSQTFTAQITGGSAAAVNTSIGSSGKTAYGASAWRLTTTAVNANTAGVKITQYAGWVRNSAVLDLSMPLVVVFVAHSVNNGSRLRVKFSATNATSTPVAAYERYISPPGVKMTGEVPDPVNVANMGLCNASMLITSGTTQVDFATDILIEAYQEGTSGITDITVLGVYQVTQKPMIHIGFDDGLKSVYDNAFPVMAARGLVGSVSVMGAMVGADAGSRQSYTNLPLMIKPEIDELIAAGWEVTVHGSSPVTGLTTYADVYNLISAQKAAVEALGDEYKRSSDFYVYPGGSATGSYTDSDGQPLAYKALKALGFRHARILGSNPSSDGLGGLGDAALIQNSLAQNYFRSGSDNIYETGTPSTKIIAFEQALREASYGGGLLETVTHNVVAQSYFPSGQPYLGSGYTGTVSTSNDTSIETFTSMMDLVEAYRDRGLLKVVLKRDWMDGLPYTLERRNSLFDGWTP